MTLRPEFYLASIMTSPDKVGEYIQEAKQLGVDILAPDINISNSSIGIVDSSIYFGLHDVKNVGKGAAIYIEKLREMRGPFKSRDHLDGIIEDEMIFWEAKRSGKSPKQKLGKGAVDALDNAGCFDRLTECPDLILRSRLQKELLGISFVDIYTPLLEKHKSTIEKYSPIVEISGEGIREGYGVISEIEAKTTRPDAKAGFSNKEYVILTMQWGVQTMKLTCFELPPEPFEIGQFWLVQMKVNSRGSTYRSGKKLAT